ncbi:MAG: hypothetical protein ACI4OR_03680 [Alphaproteobacteria bacterium]
MTNFISRVRKLAPKMRSCDPSYRFPKIRVDFKNDEQMELFGGQRTSPRDCLGASYMDFGTWKGKKLGWKNVSGHWFFGYDFNDGVVKDICAAGFL